MSRNVSIQALRTKTKYFLSSYLNVETVIKSDSNISRYWVGLAGLCQINPTMEARMWYNKDPMNELLKVWGEQDPEGATIDQLLLYLEEMDRFDVIDDLLEKIDEDIRIYHANRMAPLVPPSLENDKDILTIDDVTKINAGLPLEIYDAFVLYDQKDIDFATILIEQMEKVRGMKLVVKDRDFVGGALEYDQMIKVITRRCNRVIAVFSDDFFQSSANTYYLSFAQAYGLESQRKIIPILYKDCNVSYLGVRILSVLDYRKTVLFDFWGRLKNCLIVAQNENLGGAPVNGNNGELLPVAQTDLRPSQQVTFGDNVDGNVIKAPDKLPPTPSTPTTSASDTESKKKLVWIRKLFRASTVKNETGRKSKGFFKHVKRKTNPIAS